MNRYRVIFDEIEWESPAPGVRHKMVVTGDQKLRLVEYRPEMTPHWCSVGHYGMILEGRLEIAFDGSTQVLNAGDGVLIPSGERHRRGCPNFCVNGVKGHC